MRKQLHPLLFAIAVALILAPLGNFALSFHFYGIEGWYRPSIFLHLASQVLAIDWIWNAAVFLSGCFLILRTKLAWAFAVVAILSASGINFYKFLFDPDPNFGWSHFSITIAGSMLAILVVFFFRYPHLDRRDRWFKIHRRVPVHLKAKLSNRGQASVLVSNISLGGLFFRVEDSEKAIKGTEESEILMGQVLELSIDGQTEAFKVQVNSARTEEATGLKGYGAEFIALTESQIGYLRSMLK